MNKRCFGPGIPVLIAGFILFMSPLYLPSSPCRAVPIQSFDSEGEPFHRDLALKKAPYRYMAKLEALLARGNLEGVLFLAKRLIEVQPENGNVRAIYAIGLASKKAVNPAMQHLAAAKEGSARKIYLYCAEAMIAKATGETAKAMSAARLAAEADPRHPYPHNIIGRLYLTMEKNREAVNAFEKALQLNPDFLPAYGNLGAALYIEKNYAAAAEYFSKGLQRSPDSFNLHYGLAVTLEKTGDLPGAVTDYEAALKLNPNNDLLLAKLTTLQMQTGRFRAALAGAQAMAQKKMPGAAAIAADVLLHLNDFAAASEYLGKIDPRSPDRDYLQGYHHLLSGRYEQAGQSMERILKKDADHFAAFATHAAISFYLGKPPEMSEIQIRRWSRGSAKVLHFTAGCREAKQGNWHGAHEHWSRAEGLFGGFSLDGISESDLKNGIAAQESAALNLGVVLFFRKFYAPALLQFKKVLQQAPEEIMANYFAALTYLKMQKSDDAAVHFERAAVKAPGFFSANYAAGELYAQKGQFGHAMPFYHNALKVKFNTGLVIKLGILSEMQGDDEGAQRLYQQAIELAPENFIGYNQAAWLYVKQGIHLDRAIALAEKANRLQPENADIQDTLGWAFYQKKSYEKARRYLESARNINPDNPTVLYHLGALLAATGETGTAAELLRAALKKSGSFDGAKEAQRLLTRIR